MYVPLYCVNTALRRQQRYFRIGSQAEVGRSEIFQYSVFDYAGNSFKTFSNLTIGIVSGGLCENVIYGDRRTVDLGHDLTNPSCAWWPLFHHFVFRAIIYTYSAFIDNCYMARGLDRAGVMAVSEIPTY